MGYPLKPRQVRQSRVCGLTGHTIFSVALCAAKVMTRFARPPTRKYPESLFRIIVRQVSYHHAGGRQNYAARSALSSGRYLIRVYCDTSVPGNRFFPQSRMNCAGNAWSWSLPTFDNYQGSLEGCFLSQGDFSRHVAQLYAHRYRSHVIRDYQCDPRNRSVSRPFTPSPLGRGPG